MELVSMNKNDGFSRDFLRPSRHFFEVVAYAYVEKK